MSETHAPDWVASSTVAYADAGYVDPEDPPSVPVRIAIALERIADALEASSADQRHEAAVAAWSRGEGRHPDD